MNPWILRLIIIVAAIALVPVIISGASSLVTSGIYSVGESVNSLLRPLSLSGEARLQGIIKICLYLIAVTFLVKVLMRKW
jgi:hypothetical protein